MQKLLKETWKLDLKKSPGLKISLEKCGKFHQKKMQKLQHKNNHRLIIDKNVTNWGNHKKRGKKGAHIPPHPSFHVGKKTIGQNLQNAKRPEEYILI